MDTESNVLYGKVTQEIFQKEMFQCSFILLRLHSFPASNTINPLTKVFKTLLWYHSVKVVFEETAVWRTESWWDRGRKNLLSMDKTVEDTLSFEGLGTQHSGEWQDFEIKGAEFWQSTEKERTEGRRGESVQKDKVKDTGRGDRLEVWRQRGVITVRRDWKAWTPFPPDSPALRKPMLHLLFVRS